MRTWTSPPESFLWRSDVDKGTRLATLSILEVLHEAMKRATATHILTLQIHGALVKARVPDYPEAYDSRDDNPLLELTNVKNKVLISLTLAFKHLERIARGELLQAIVLDRGEACLPC